MSLWIKTVSLGERWYHFCWTYGLHLKVTDVILKINGMVCLAVNFTYFLLTNLIKSSLLAKL